MQWCGPSLADAWDMAAGGSGGSASLQNPPAHTLVLALLPVPQERAFLYFDSSLDGTLEREELVAALCSGTKRIGSSKEKSNSRQSSKGPKRYKGAADMLFDVLDLDKSGSITFKGECAGGVRQGKDSVVSVDRMWYALKRGASNPPRGINRGSIVGSAAPQPLAMPC